MTLQRMEHTGNAIATSLQSGITPTATTFVVQAGSGFPTGGVGPFVVAIDPDLATEEKILCSLRSSNTFTVAPVGRGWDGTVAGSHNTNAVVKHMWSAAEADDSNAHIYLPSRDDHTQYVPVNGSRPITGGLTISSGGLTVTGNGSFSGTVSAASVAATGSVTANGNMAAASYQATGLPGTTAASLWGGAVSNGAPTSGTWAVGSVVVDQTGGLWQCVSGGTPGTWQRISFSAPQYGILAASTAVSSTAWADLSTPLSFSCTPTGGLPGGRVLVGLSGVGYVAASPQVGYLTVAVDGTVGASSYQYQFNQLTPGASAGGIQLVGALTAASHTFTVKVSASSGGTFTCSNVGLFVQPY